MKVAVIGVGAMGVLMAGHLHDKGHTVFAHDLDPKKLADAAACGATPVTALGDVAAQADIFILMVATESQVRHIVTGLTTAISSRQKGSTLIAIAATTHPAPMQELSISCAQHGVRFIDAPVVFGMPGARDGTLLTLCGGLEEDVEFARPALSAYSRDVLHVGPAGAGQLAKACNNLLHWIHSIGNYEALLLAKRYGVDARRMREILLRSPGNNGTLESWDSTKFTWQEKDMDVVMDLAQDAGLVLPLSGQTDQLIKLFNAKAVEELMEGSEASYLGRKFSALPVSEGGLGG
jgi:3-hydroxyisobutyrate dehydrogenase